MTLGTLSSDPQPKMASQRIPSCYPNRAAVLFATGPGLTPESVELIRPYHASGKVVAFGCNDSYRLVDYLDVHYACDGPWWKIHKDKVFQKLPPDCQVWTQDKKTAQDLSINLILGKHQNGLDLEQRDNIYFGSNSGYQLLNIAYHYGIRKFLLVGYNMGVVDHKTHFFGDHPQGLAKTSPYKKFIENYGTIQQEVKDMVINCTPNSALTCFNKLDLEEALKSL